MGTAIAELQPCVHCGFCLQSCPTFLVTGDEADSPRGRIVLMQAMAAGRLPASDPQLTGHLDRCLGCRGCEPACPSGVSYGAALEIARHLLSNARPIPPTVRLVHRVMADRSLHGPAFALARLVRPIARSLAGRSSFGFAFGMLAATKKQGEWGQKGQWGQKNVQSSAPPAPPAPTAALFRGCIMDGLFSHVHDATERVLRANGYELADVPGQTCCGALHAHAGQHDDAMALARQNVTAFGSVPDEPVIAVNAAGCGAMLKEYERLLADDPLRELASRVSARVRDVSEMLAERGPRRGASIKLRVAYDPPCHLLHAQRIANQPLSMLAAVGGLEAVSHDEAELCCGSAGSYTLAQPELSRAVLERKVGAIREVQPDVVASGNPGCAMQIGAGLLAAGERVPVVHPVEILDWSYGQAGYYV